MLIVDAGVLYAQADRAERRHAAVVNLLKSERGALVTTEAVVAEADYLILRCLGVVAELAFLDDLANKTFDGTCLTDRELRLARDVARRYRDLQLGLADASLVVLADRLQTRRIATFDERAFRTVTPLRLRYGTVATGTPVPAWPGLGA
ncbi:MAG: type II toxin-antitoxin system VapC family toxin [Chloroflexota bacterium]